MKVSNCENCIHSQKRRWSSYYEPKNYHPIGMSHVFMVCCLNNKRALEVRKSECKKEVCK